MDPDSKVVNLHAPPSAVRSEFIAWQCRLRKQAMREAGGRPSEGMCPDVLDAGGAVLGRTITVLLARVDAAAMAQLFEFQYKRTEDPLERYEKAVTTLSADYYQRPENFSGTMAALFGSGMSLVRRLIAERQCVLVFEQFTHQFHVPCAVDQLSRHDALFKATYWHNAMFNPNLPGDVAVLAFEPDWASVEHRRIPLTEP